MLPKAVLLYGRDEPLPERIDLHAGPLNLIYENGDLRYIKYGDREVIRRIYVAIRDRNWGTIPPIFSNVKMDIGSDSFHISYDVENKQGEVDFAWRAEITGDASGNLLFSMDGVARATFWKNRIGFCILHPAFLAGQRSVVEHVDGSSQEASLPTIISADQPVQPFAELRAMTHEVIPGVWAETRYTGDIFELEDQRNWTDASFKTFCTPLSLPYPVEIPQGTRITQSVSLSLRDERPSMVASGAAAVAPQPLTFSIGSLGEATPMPSIGLGIASHGQPLSQVELKRLAALNLGHLRVDLPLSEQDFPETLKRAWDEANSLGLPLEVALLISPNGEEELLHLRRILEEVHPQILRWLVFPAKESYSGGSPTREVLELAHKHLDGFGSDPEFCSGSNTDLIYMTRNMPPLDQTNAVSFAITAEVHAFDEASVVETLEAQPMVIETARHLAGNKPVIVSPVTFKMRHNPYASGPWPVMIPGELPPMVDVRQMSLFGAAWTVGSIKALAESGAHSLTYFETSGWRGVMETTSGSSLPEKFRSLPGGVYPMYHVFADIGEYAGGQVIPSLTSDNQHIDGIALHKDGRVRVLVANLTPHPQTVQVCNVGAQVICHYMDESNVLEAMQSTESFRQAAGEMLVTQTGSLELKLLPYGVARLDSE